MDRIDSIEPKRKPYAKPAIVHAEALQARAVVCARQDETTCSGGPLQS